MAFTSGGTNHQCSSTYEAVASVFDSITATASGTQANSFVLPAQFNRITTVASTNDGVKLPPSTLTPGQLGSIGCKVWIRNSGANSAQVFGSGTDTINDVAYATGVALAAGKTAVYTLVSISSAGVGAWYMLLSA